MGLSSLIWSQVWILSKMATIIKNRKFLTGPKQLYLEPGLNSIQDGHRYKK
jgi:hypothetical protein